MIFKLSRSKVRSNLKLLIYFFWTSLSGIIILLKGFGLQDTRAVGPFSASRVYGQTAGFTSQLPNNGAVSASGLNQPIGVAHAPGGGIYVADRQNSRVLFFPTGNSTASKVYGQPDFTSNTANNGGISASRLNHPVGVALDSGGNLYIADSGNNRVLYFPAGTATATRVYGQPNFTSSAVNNGGISATSLNNPQALGVDPSNHLYVADSFNNRVLYYPSITTTATIVYGQPNLTSNTINNGGLSATSLRNPTGVALDSTGNLYIADNNNSRALYYPGGITTATRVYGKPDFISGPNFDFPSNTTLQGPTGITVDSSGVYIADYAESSFQIDRILHYPASSTTADQVYGEPDFSSFGHNNGGRSATSLYGPIGLAADGSGGLYVADALNNRILHYSSGSPTASEVYGRPDFTSGSTDNGVVNSNSLYTPWLLTVDTGGGLYVSDIGNSRVLYYPPGTTTASRVYGQTNFSSDDVSYISNASNFNEPRGLALSPSGGLYVADFNFNRILYFEPGSTTPTTVYGQPDFDSYSPNNDELNASSLYGPEGLAVTTDEGMYVADAINQRVLFFPAGSLTATRVYGQPDFTSNIPNNGGLSAASLDTPQEVAVDNTGGLYVTDAGNNRVLYYPTGSTIATRVYGQPNFTSNNQGGSATSNTFNNPRGLAVDQAGGLYIADQSNQRVLYFPPGSTKPNYVFGQLDFTSNTLNNGGLSASSLNVPLGLTLDNSGNLYIADTGNNRVLFYDQTITTQNQNDDGSGNTVGTFSNAIQQANSGTYRVIAFSPGLTSINLTGNRLPEVNANVTILGRCGSSGPQITINGTNANPANAGLVLNGAASVFGLDLKNFPGGQLVARSTYGHNQAGCMRVSR